MPLVSAGVRRSISPLGVCYFNAVARIEPPKRIEIENGLAGTMRTFQRQTLRSLCVVMTLAVALFLFRTPTPTALSAKLHVPPEFEIQRVAGPDLTSYPMMGTVD